MNKEEFKVGDVVEVINDDIFARETAKMGDVGKIICTDEWGFYIVEFEKGTQFVYPAIASDYIKKVKSRRGSEKRRNIR